MGACFPRLGWSSQKKPPFQNLRCARQLTILHMSFQGISLIGESLPKFLFHPTPRLQDMQNRLVQHHGTQRGCGSGLGFLTKCPNYSVNTSNVAKHPVYLLDVDNTCILSMPSCTCDLHICCWHSGEMCQARAAAAFTLFNYAQWSSSKRR